MVEIDLKDPYTKEQLDNIIEFENTMIKKCGMDGIKSLANMACEVSKYEGLVATSVQERSFCHKERPCVLGFR